MQDVDILINNAGFALGMKKTFELTVDDIVFYSFFLFVVLIVVNLS